MSAHHHHGHHHGHSHGHLTGAMLSRDEQRAAARQLSLAMLALGLLLLGLLWRWLAPQQEGVAQMLLGVASLLYDLPSPAVTAGPEGAECLVLARSHFHTVTAECPEVLIGYLTGQADAAPAP